MKKLIYLLTIVLGSCAFTNEDVAESAFTGLENTVSSVDFKWSSSSDWEFQVDYSQIETPIIGKKVLLLDDRGNKIQEYRITSTNDKYIFKTAASTEYITVFIPSLGLTKNITADVSSLEMSSSNARTAKATSEINCDCENPVEASTGTIILLAGETKCLSGNFNGSVFFMTGGTLNVCGTVSFSNIYGNASGKLNIHEQGVVTISNWNNNFVSDELTNFGSLTFPGSMSINKGVVINHGDWTVKGSLSINSGHFENNGTMTVSGSFAINSYNYNNGSLTLKGSNAINSNASLENNCYLHASGISVDGKIYAGGGTFLETDGTIYLNSNGKIQMSGENAMIKTKKLYLNGEISINEGINNLYIEELFQFNNSGRITTVGSPLYLCSPNFASINANVARGCENVIPQTSCNPMGLNAKKDADGDGSTDEEDQFPTDPSRSYQLTEPGSGYKVTVFEDLWPYRGDYDFNDMVIKHKVVYTKDAQNRIVDGTYTLIIQNIGASKSNGIGLHILENDNGSYKELSSNVISEVSSANWDVKIKGNNVITITDDVFASVDGYYQNNGTGITKSPDTISFTVQFNFSTAKSIISDLYIFRSEEPGLEIHLPDVPPTQYANNDLFNTGHDRSGAGIWYRTENNLPWAVEIFLNDDEHYDAPLEGVSIEHAYPGFMEWVRSSGTSNQSWHKEENANKVFKN